MADGAAVNFGTSELWRQSFEQLSRTQRRIAYHHRGTGVLKTPARAISGHARRQTRKLQAYNDLFLTQEVLAPNMKPHPQRRSGWTDERRAKQAQAIRQWKPCHASTGPVTAGGKARASQNASKPNSIRRERIQLRAQRCLPDVGRTPAMK